MKKIDCVNVSLLLLKFKPVYFWKKMLLFLCSTSLFIILHRDGPTVVQLRYDQLFSVFDSYMLASIKDKYEACIIFLLSHYK